MRYPEAIPALSSTQIKAYYVSFVEALLHFSAREGLPLLERSRLLLIRRNRLDLTPKDLLLVRVLMREHPNLYPQWKHYNTNLSAAIFLYNEERLNTPA